MKSVSSWIWTLIAVSISYDDNHYTTGISTYTTGTSTKDWYVIQPNSLTLTFIVIGN